MSDHEQILIELLNKIIAEQALVAPRVKIHPISSGGANFTTQLFQATISLGDNELKLFAKVAAVGEKFRQQLPDFRLFETENDFYTKLMKIYENLQEKHNVPQDKRFVAPKCYGCSGKLYEEVIVLEDLSAQGFTVYDRMKSVDWDYASKAVEEIAKFHALSFAFENENKEEFDKYLSELTFKWDSENPQFDEIIQKGLSVVKEENRSRLEAFLATFSWKSFDEISKPAKFTVLAHCDNRVSNQMYKVHEDGRVEVKIVDYQTIRGASPALDLLYFIFSGTDEKFRAEHYDRLLDHYYNKLSLAMKRLGLNPDEIYSREDFNFEYQTKLPFGLSLAVITLPLVTIDEENAPKVDKDLDINNFVLDNTSDVFSERLNGVVNDFLRWGFL
ncbi:uncharacterized protein LOC119188455 [Manduca sexta]|uniref:uncharacterized protein LOC119188455 n=1 Tax=Manduca sexta TaxID=7130 RepID=UPI00188F1C91|nr:uncharacterized protein LOC119188455 [Manduca sexta]XP_037301129.1 uncharacterized protein LOC119188455 [Manduca sexta]